MSGEEQRQEVALARLAAGSLTAAGWVAGRRAESAPELRELAARVRAGAAKLSSSKALRAYAVAEEAERQAEALEAGEGEAE